MRRSIALTAAFAATLAAPVLAEAPRVVTDIPAVHALVAQVMGDRGAPALLTTRGANEHAMQLRPSQAAALAEADLIIWVGPQLTPWLDRALDGIGPSGATLALLDVPGTVLRTYGDGDGAHDGHAHGDDGDDAAAGEHKHGEGHAHGQGHGHDHAHGHGHGHGHGHDHGHDDHAHEGTDPHAWLDPGNARVWVGAIADALAERDPDHAAVYAANAEAAAARLTGLDAAIGALLAPVRDRPFVVFHDAYGYFAEHYGLTVAGSVALGDASAPGAARIAALRDHARETGAVCAFPEAQHDDRLIAAVAEGTGLRIGAALDPSGTSLEPGPDLYATLLTSMAEGIAACLATPG